MGKKAKWFGAVKKVFSPESKKKTQAVVKPNQSDTSTSESFEASADYAAAPPARHDAADPVAETARERSVLPPLTAAPAAAEVEAVRATALSKLSGEAREEAAAIRIQTAFRGYLARRALRALRGLVRLKSMIDGNSVKRQAATTLRCMQTLARVQSQIRSRRMRMSEENQALQRQLLLKRERELESLRMGDEWDDSLQSKEQIEASLTSKQEAAIRRERALAYAFSHQWKNSSKSANPLFMDPNNPQWGWSWMERWMAARPWEGRSSADKDPSIDQTSAKSIGGEIMNAYARRDNNSDRPLPLPAPKKPSHQSPVTPPSRAPSLAGRMVKSASPRNSWPLPEDDSRSMVSMQSERYQRHSMAGSSVGDDESLASSPAVPSYMAPTKSARARTRFQSASTDKTEMTLPEKAPIASVKKRLSFPVGEKQRVTSLAGARRHSGPPKVDVSAIKDATPIIHSEQNGSNGTLHFVRTFGLVVVCISENFIVTYSTLE